MGDHTIDIEEASEPTDIIWENRQYTPWQRTVAAIWVTISITLMLFVSFVIIFYCSNVSNAAISKYPVIAPEQCEYLGTGANGSYDWAFMQKQSSNEFTNNVASEKLGFDVSYSKGYL